MAVSVRQHLTWCRYGAAIGVAVAAVGFAAVRPSAGTVLAGAAAGILVGAAGGFMAAAFFLAVQSVGVGPLCRRAIQGAATGAVVAAAAHSCGLTGEQSWTAAVILAAAIFGLMAGYFYAVEISTGQQ